MLGQVVGGGIFVQREPDWTQNRTWLNIPEMRHTDFPMNRTTTLSGQTSEMWPATWQGQGASVLLSFLKGLRLKVGIFSS